MGREVSVLFDADRDKRLEAVVPDYLRGERKTTMRLHWAIDQFLSQHEPSSGDVAVDARDAQPVAGPGRGSERVA